MTVSLVDTKSRIGNATAVSNAAMRVTVTGVDVKGQMFRRPATILRMDGHDCMFRSDRQPESGGSVLIECDFQQPDHKRQVLHASVKSTAADADTGFYMTVVELEVAQAGKILHNPVEIQTATLKSAPAPVITPPREIPSRSPSNGMPHVVPGPDHQVGPRANGEVREALPKSQVENATVVREAIKSTVALEIKQELTSLRAWISSELQKTLPGIVSSNMEKMIREAVDKQTAANHETSVQTLNANVSRQIEERIAELRNVLEAKANRLAEEKPEVSRTTDDRVEQDLSSHAAAIMRSLEESAAELAKKLSNEQTELSRSAGERVEQELSSHAAAIMRSFEESTAEMAKRLVDQQTDLSRTAGDRVELELNSRASTIMSSFEDSTAEMAKRLVDQQTELSRAAGDRIELELSSRASTIMRSFEESAPEVASKLFEEKNAALRSAADNAERELNSRAAAIMRFVEESTAEMETRINASRAATEVVVTKSQSLQQEINDGMLPLQQALRQLHDANRDGIEKLQSQAISEINRRAAQFEERLEMISSERAIGFAAEIESRMAPSHQQAEELLEKLGAVFQLLQSTARVQQEKLAEHSKAAAANFEKEIRSILLRFAGGPQL